MGGDATGEPGACDGCDSAEEVKVCRGCDLAEIKSEQGSTEGAGLID